ncbi:MAG: fumarate hydratase [Candidatus Hydrogenedentota bacterium]
MRELDATKIKESVKKLCIEANFYLAFDVIDSLKKAYEEEVSPFGKEILKQILENSKIAQEERLPLCQDCGFTVVFCEIGQEVVITGGSIREAINQGVREAYKEAFLRKSILNDPIIRKNTGDNTPSIIHFDIVPGDKIKIIIAPKGGGSENMSRVSMLTPSDGRSGIINFIVKTVVEAGSNPCPPTIIGVGIGGTFEYAAYLAKKALLRKVGEPSSDPDTAQLEKEILQKINNSGVGPMGLGGRITSLAVHIIRHPCHIASLPVAVNVQCHSARHKEAIL